ncbi:hypothetical protein T12_2430 [Trichinella patagoniensis]|uniref:Uncharacterized protein n=1 Tax=Trichinella patagoniensis TaxID=990121 RepID=A0A0V0YU55_9BILA|nr:hypothetical protein T12_2430 [Trichinella patagoniensis]
MPASVGCNVANVQIELKMLLPSLREFNCSTYVKFQKTLRAEYC